VAEDGGLTRSFPPRFRAEIGLQEEEPVEGCWKRQGRRGWAVGADVVHVMQEPPGGRAREWGGGLVRLSRHASERDG